MTRIICLLIVLLSAESSVALPNVSIATLCEERSASFAKNVSINKGLEVALRVQGIKNIRTYGDLKVTEAKTDSGDDLIRRPKDPRASRGVTNLYPFQIVTDYEIWRGRFDLDIILKPSPRKAKTFSFKGSFDVLEGGKVTHIDFPMFRNLEGKTLEHKAFRDAGLKINLKRSDSEKRIRYTIGGNNSILSKITLIDAAGKDIPISSSGAAGSIYTGRTFWMRTSRAIPKDAKLRVTIFEGGQLKTVPFEFQKIELP